MEEIWKKVPGYQGTYSVSNLGNVRNDITGCAIHPRFINSGYMSVQLRDTAAQKYKPRLLHKLLAELFIRNPENMRYVKFKDNNTQNCSLDNLYWSNQHHRSANRTKTYSWVVQSSDLSEPQMIFDSISQVAKHIGYAPESVRRSERTGQPLGGKWSIYKVEKKYTYKEDGWEPVPGSTVLLAHPDGYIKNQLTGYVLKPTYSNAVHLGQGQSMRYSRVIATTFIPNPENLRYLRFKDGDNSNLSASNLEWTSAKPQRYKVRYIVVSDKQSHTFSTQNQVSEFLGRSIRAICDAIYSGEQLISDSGEAFSIVRIVNDYSPC